MPVYKSEHRQEQLDGLEALRWVADNFERVSEICYAAEDEPDALARIVAALNIDIDAARTVLISGFIYLDAAARDRVVQVTARVRDGS